MSATRARSFLLLGSLLLASSQARPGGDHDHAHESPHGGAVRNAGAHQLELQHDGRHGTLTLYVSSNGPGGSPIPSRSLTARIEPLTEDPWHQAFEVRLLPIPQAQDGDGLSSRFVGTDAGLVGLEGFEAVVTLALDGQPRTVEFLFDGEALPEYVCPMRCEGARAYPGDGRCPVCTMPLRPRGEAHGDHTPKHGGVLFMAADGWHHLEGVLEANEFRVYVYNDFTLPISATPLAPGSSAAIVSLDENGVVEGEPVTVGLRASPRGTYLRAPIPAGLRPPLEIELLVRFEGRDEPDGFLFRFP